MTISEKLKKYRKILERLEMKLRADPNNEKLSEKIWNYKLTIEIMKIWLKYDERGM
jgi:hypothetical protein